MDWIIMTKQKLNNLNSDNLSRYISLYYIAYNWWLAALHVVPIQIQMVYRAQGRICIFIYPLIRTIPAYV